MKLPFVLGLCGTAALAGCAHLHRPAPAPAAVAPEPPAPTALAAVAPIPDLSAYRLGIGDRIRIDVFGEPDLSMDATIDPTGHISYPLLGAIDAVRKTARELQDKLTQGLAAGFLVKPDVRVVVVQYRPFYIIGQIQRSGAYGYVIGLTVEKALALAGGMTNLASTRRIFLLREDNLPDRRIRVGMDALVLPGDTLIVEEGLF